MGERAVLSGFQEQGFTHHEEASSKGYRLEIEGVPFTINLSRDIYDPGERLDTYSELVRVEIENRRDTLKHYKNQILYRSHGRRRRSQDIRVTRLALEPHINKVLREINVLRGKESGKISFVKNGSGVFIGLKIEAESKK